ncbi:MAG: hypothetical protein ISR65_15755 [Bacteriovoracaceae bacterium]|nr:hypothetical protein [Bacteriovoracaceae bacterium]
MKAKLIVLITALICSVSATLANIPVSTLVHYDKADYNDGIFSIEVVYGGCHELDFGIKAQKQSQSLSLNKSIQPFVIETNDFAGDCRMLFKQTLEFDMVEEYGVHVELPIEVIAGGKAVFQNGLDAYPLKLSNFCTKATNEWGNPLLCDCSETTGYNERTGLCD